MTNLFNSKKSTDRHHIPAPSASRKAELKALDVPLIDLPDCHACEDPCDGEEAYARLDIDLNETDLLGSMNEYGRMAVVSTAVSDWPRDVTDASGNTLAELLDKAYTKSEKAAGHSKPPKAREGAGISVFPSSLDCRKRGKAPNRKITLLNGSHLSPSDQTSVLVFPDYKIVQEVAATPQDAASFVSTSLTPDVGPLPPLDTTNRFQTWPLAYRAVILLCSHKRRDKRCHIIAPLLRAEFGRVLDSEGIEVDARGDEAEHGPEPCMEEWDDEDREARYERARRRAASSNAVGIFNVSHIGGHRYAGNVIICLPSGASVWYGRVSPREVEAIVKETLLGGRVITELLRGGIGLGSKPNGVLSW